MCRVRLLCCVAELDVIYAGNMLMTSIFRLILALVHYGYTVFEALESRFMFVRRILSNVWLPDAPRTNHGDVGRARETETLLLESIVERVSKLPVHLCIVVGYQEQISFGDLVRILGWCINVGIPYVSFYDHNGFLKQNQDILRAECERSRPKLASLIDWESRSSSNKHRKDVCNGFKRKAKVQIFSNVDGKGEIVTLAQNLSRAVLHGLLKMEEIDTELLNDKLRLDDTPDPDVVFVCGPALSTYGLLPWHTRTTEFFNLRSHRDVSIKDFTFLLEKYGLCQQRYGE